MNYNYLKKLSIVALSLMTSVMSMMAANTISIGGFNIEKNDTKTLSIDVASDGTLSVMQFELTLPEGLTLQGGFQKTDALGSSFVTTKKLGDAERYLVLITNPDLVPIAEGMSSILNFEVKSSEDYDPSSSVITLANIKGADTNGDVAVVNKNGSFYNQNAGATEGGVTVDAGDVNVLLLLNNKIDLAHVGATITLPDGLAIAEDESGNLAVEVSGRVAGGVECKKVPDSETNDYTVILGDGDNVIKKGNGLVFSFKLVANDGFDGKPCEVIIKDVNVSDLNAKSYDFNGVTVAIDEETAEYLKNAPALDEAKKAAIEAIQDKVKEMYGDGDVHEAVSTALSDAVFAIKDAMTFDAIATEKQNGLDAILNAYTMSFTKADIDENGEVDIYDYAELALFIMGQEKGYVSSPEMFAGEGVAEYEQQRLFNLHDVNEDAKIDIADLVAVVNEIKSATDAEPVTKPEVSRAKAIGGAAAISTEISGNDLVFNLSNSAQLVALQMDVTISGAEVMDKQLSRRAGAHELMVRQLEGDAYRIMIVGMQNKAFEGNSGELFRLSLNGIANGVEFGKVVAADANAQSYTVAVGGTATGIGAIDADAQAVKAYTIGGQMQNGIKAGLNIVVGADGKARKVMK